MDRKKEKGAGIGSFKEDSKLAIHGTNFCIIVFTVV